MFETFFEVVIHGQGDLAEDELRGINMIEVTRLFLLDQVFKDADVFGLQNLDCEEFRRVTSKNKAVERKWIGSYDRLVHFSRR